MNAKCHKKIIEKRVVKLVGRINDELSDNWFHFRVMLNTFGTQNIENLINQKQLSALKRNFQPLSNLLFHYLFILIFFLFQGLLLNKQQITIINPHNIVFRFGKNTKKVKILEKTSWFQIFFILFWQIVNIPYLMNIDKTKQHRKFRCVLVYWLNRWRTVEEFLARTLCFMWLTFDLKENFQIFLLKLTLIDHIVLFFAPFQASNTSTIDCISQ